MFTQSAPVSAPPATIRDDRSRKSVNDDNRLHRILDEIIEYLPGLTLVQENDPRWVM